MYLDNRQDLRDHLAAQAVQMAGASWISIPLDTMSKQELLGVIATMRRNADEVTKHHHTRMKFVLSSRRR